MENSRIIYQKVKKKYLEFLSSQEVMSEPFRDKLGQLNKFYLPISKMIKEEYMKKNKTKVIGLTGGQGTGKSTISKILQITLEEKFNLKTTIFSIDDFYKTLKERKKMSQMISPLFLTRGVPGTHDISMGLDLIEELSVADIDSITKIPSFCKPEDKHYPESDWPIYKGKPDFIFFDAWCGGAKPISEENWEGPMNDLEREEDLYGVWSKWSNRELAKDYQKLFDKFDLLLMIKVPSMDFVYRSRWIQEQTLAKTIKDPILKDKIMTREEVYRFVMHYERLTHYILEEIPKFSDIVLERDEQFLFSIAKAP